MTLKRWLAVSAITLVALLALRGAQSIVADGFYYWRW